MAKKKVLFLIESLIVGGAEKILLEIVNHLDYEQFDVTVCSVFKYSVYKQYDKVFETPLRKEVHFRHIINNRYKFLYIIFNYLLPRIPTFLYNIFLNKDYDTLVAFYEGLPTTWLGNINIKKGKKIAWLHTSASLSMNGWSEEKIVNQGKLYKSFDQIIAVSNGVADSYRSIFNDLSIQTVFNPINSSEIIKKSLQERNEIIKKRLTFVSVGRMTPAKGYDRWLRVVNNLIKMGYEFDVWIIGGGDSSHLQQFIRDENLEDYVKLWGHQSNPYPFIKKADWYCCPSIVEGLSTTVIEAVILEKPIVVTDCPGMSDILGDSEYGIILNNNEQDIINGIKNILDNSVIKSKYIKKAKLRKSYFKIDNSISEISRHLAV